MKVREIRGRSSRRRCCDDRDQSCASCGIRAHLPPLWTPPRRLPPLIPYFREVWRRRAFATEMSRATMRGANTSTFFGQAWLVLNPLLLAAVYYILVTIIRRENDPAFFAHLTLGIFAFQLVGTSVTSGATSVTSSGKLLLNTPFPRLLIPLSAVRTAFFRFLPTVPVYFVFHAIFLTHVVTQDAALPVLPGDHDRFRHGVGCFLRSAPGLLPRHVELSAVLRTDLDVLVPDLVGTRTHHRPILRPIMTLIQLNPMYSMIGGYTELLQNDAFPTRTCGSPRRCGHSRPR